VHAVKIADRDAGLVEGLLLQIDKRNDIGIGINAIRHMPDLSYSEKAPSLK
jgi:hypothetical protein